jgi:hypothetical protein
MADPTIVFFGQFPTTIVLVSSDAFNGTVHTGAPVITPGAYVFPTQTGGGLYNFNTLVGTQEPIDIKNITWKGTGTLTIKQVLPGPVEATIGTITSDQGAFFTDLTISPAESIKFYSASPGTVSVTALLTNSAWAT